MTLSYSSLKAFYLQPSEFLNIIMSCCFRSKC